MGLLDRLLGRSKQATGDMLGDSSLKREGAHQEQAGLASERAEQAEQLAQDARADEARHRAEEHGHEL